MDQSDQLRAEAERQATGHCVPVPDAVIRAGLEPLYKHAYLRGMRRMIVSRIISRFGNDGVLFGVWLTQFEDVNSLESFFEAIETAPDIEELIALLPSERCQAAK